VSASGYYQRATGHRCSHSVEDERLLQLIHMLRNGETVPRCQVQRLMRAAGIRGAKRRGKPWRTTAPDPAASRAPDRVERDFTASRPDELWVADFTYLRCWQGPVFFRLRRRLQSPDRGLAVRVAHAHRPRPRRATHGARYPPSRRRHRADSSLRCRISIDQFRCRADANSTSLLTRRGSTLPRTLRQPPEEGRISTGREESVSPGAHT
jgi:hypothetical protein